MEFRQTGCVPPPQQQHFQSPQSFFSRHNHRLVLLWKVRYIEHLLNMRLPYEIIGNELKQPVNDRALIGNGIYKPVTDRFNICNGLF
jgi:hypothetical protein